MDGRTDGPFSFFIYCFVSFFIFCFRFLLYFVSVVRRFYVVFFFSCFSFFPGK